MSESSQPHILFISRQPPKQGTGSHIIFERHLKRLEDSNWEISIVAPEHSLKDREITDSWNVISLPKRRWWWLPFRKNMPFSFLIRMWYWERECKHNLKGKKISAILADRWDEYSFFAAFLAQRWKIPFSLIIHDRPESWAKSDAERQKIAKQTEFIIDRAERIWTVSPELADAYGLKLNSKTSVLLPIPNGEFSNISLKEKFGDREFIVAHAGSLHPFQFNNFKILADCLKKVNGVLLLIASENNPTFKKLKKECSNIKCQKPFETNIEAIQFLGRTANCLLVSYSFDLSQQLWAKTSFPSKLVEFAHLGIPILILAPPETAISNWASNNNWLGYVSSLEDKKINDVLNKLTNYKDWLIMAEQSKKIAVETFAPENIHNQFESEIAIAAN